MEWQPVSKVNLHLWTLAYSAFLIYAGLNNGEFLFIDQVNLIVHEAGHLLFGWFGSTLGLWGGTLLELAVPAMLAAYFLVHRELPASVFCAFFLFENLLYVATYMADARAQVLPLVTVGDPEAGGHDWHQILLSLGLLEYDQVLARIVRSLGWLGMMSAIGYFWLAVGRRHADKAE
jgi:hypothetical protein